MIEELLSERKWLLADGATGTTTPFTIGVMSGTQLIAIGLVVAGGLIWWLRPGAKATPARTATATR